MHELQVAFLFLFWIGSEELRFDSLLGDDTIDKHGTELTVLTRFIRNKQKLHS